MYDTDDSNLKAMHDPYFEHAEVYVPSIEHATAISILNVC